MWCGGGRIFAQAERKREEKQLTRDSGFIGDSQHGGEVSIGTSASSYSPLGTANHRRPATYFYHGEKSLLVHQPCRIMHRAYKPLPSQRPDTHDLHTPNAMSPRQSAQIYFNQKLQSWFPMDVFYKNHGS